MLNIFFKKAPPRVCSHAVHRNHVSTREYNEGKQEQTEVIPHLIFLYFVYEQASTSLHLPFNW